MHRDERVGSPKGAFTVAGHRCNLVVHDAQSDVPNHKGNRGREEKRCGPHGNIKGTTRGGADVEGILTCDLPHFDGAKKTGGQRSCAGRPLGVRGVSDT